MAMKVRYTTVNGEVIAEKRNGVRRLYVPDPLGSTVALLDNTQSQVDTFTYWPYGEVRISTGTSQPPFQFVGEVGYYSDGIGRTYVRARHLHTQKGRWLTNDPIGFDGGDWNLYRYAANRPTLLTDALGLSIIGSQKDCTKTQSFHACLTCCDQNYDSAIRLCWLWFRNNQDAFTRCAIRADNAKAKCQLACGDSFLPPDHDPHHMIPPSLFC